MIPSIWRPVFLLFLILARPARADADSHSVMTEPRQAAGQTDATQKQQDRCNITGRYRATLTLAEEFGGNVCPPQKTVVLEFTLRMDGKGPVPKIIKGAESLGLQKNIKAEIAIQREDECGINLDVSSDKSRRDDDFSDSAYLKLTLKRRGTSLTGTGSYERSITARAGNATGSRSDQCSMNVTVTGRIDSP